MAGFDKQASAGQKLRFPPHEPGRDERRAPGGQDRYNVDERLGKQEDILLRAP